METPYEKKFGKVEKNDKKKHRRGWWRSAYYWLGWEYDSENDYPKEEDVNKKQVLMKQVQLSKLKLNHVDVKTSTPFDLIKIKSGKKKVPNILKDSKKKNPFLNVKKLKRIEEGENEGESEIEKEGIPKLKLTEIQKKMIKKYKSNRGTRYANIKF